LLGLALILGFFTRVTAFLSGLLLLLFAMTMTFALGIKAPLDFRCFRLLPEHFCWLVGVSTP
jgi:uncharacterized membrane protein YphA (DoxX/SURF4 family)